MPKSSDVNREFAYRLRRFRKAKRLTMKDFAREVSLSYSYIRSLEAGIKSIPPVDVLLRFSSVLGIDVGELIGETDSEPDVLVDPRLRFLASNASKLSDEDLETVERLIERLVREDNE